eukprot:3797416-Pleurochrysis_carterae.AAC.3
MAQITSAGAHTRRKSLRARPIRALLRRLKSTAATRRSRQTECADLIDGAETPELHRCAENLQRCAVITELQRSNSKTKHKGQNAENELQRKEPRRHGYNAGRGA